MEENKIDNQIDQEAYNKFMESKAYFSKFNAIYEVPATSVDISKADLPTFTEEEIDYIYNFISANCNTISIDNIMSIIEEILIFAINKDGKLNKENLAKLLNNFNIVKKKDATGVGFSKSTTITDFENEVFDFSGASEDDEDEDDDEKIEDEDKILPYYSDEDGD